MHSILLYYPKNSIYILDSNKFREIYTTVTCDKKLYLLNTYWYNKRVCPGIQLALVLKNKDNIIYSELLTALKEINNGKSKYEISKEVCDKIINMMNMKSYINQIDICKYLEYYKYLNAFEKTMLQLINKKVAMVRFIFYHRWFVL